MARSKNDKMVYAYRCKVTDKVIKINPKQFQDTVARFGLTDSELLESMVSREGRHQITSEKLTVAQAMEKYKLHEKVARGLKCTIKEPSPTAAPTADTLKVAVVESSESPKSDDSNVIHYDVHRDEPEMEKVESEEHSEATAIAA